MSKSVDYIDLLRVHQYLKNGFIYMPMFFAGEATNLYFLLRATYAFVAFSLVASSIYIFNDLRDLEEDRKHPVKNFRPLAGGRVSQKEAVIVATGLILAGLGLSVAVFPIGLTGLLLAYVIMNVFYSIKLKHLPIVDVTVISLGFVLRLYVGSVACTVPLSNWIVVMTFLLALFIALAKRRDDVILRENSGNSMRRSIDGYNLTFLNAGMAIMASVVIVAYVMYTISPEIIGKFRTEKLFMTTIFVVLGILRYLQLTFVENATGSPTRVLLTDRFLQVCICLWLLSFAVILYIKG